MEPVLDGVVVHVLEILAPKTLEHVEEVDAASRVQRRDGTVGRPALEPRPARARPRGPRHEGLNVGKVVVDCRLRWHDCLDALGLALSDDAGDVLGNVLAESEDAAVSDRGVRAEES